MSANAFGEYDLMKSTEDNYASCDLKFYGEFAGLRERVDYSHHNNYIMKRQIFQDTIINEFLNSVGTKSTQPWMVFTAGAMGVGKGYTMGKLLEKGHFPLHTFIHVDPDEIRNRLPEFQCYVKENPEFAGQMTQKEAGFIADIISMAGLQAGKNVLVDGTLRDAEWYQLHLKQLRNDFPALRLSILYVTAPRDEVFERVQQRALVTGRLVPKQTLLEALEAVPKSVQILAPYVDYYAELKNETRLRRQSIQLETPGETREQFRSRWVSGSRLRRQSIQLVTTGETWENFRAQWVPACA